MQQKAETGRFPLFHRLDPDVRCPPGYCKQGKD